MQFIDKYTKNRLQTSSKISGGNAPLCAAAGVVPALMYQYDAYFAGFGKNVSKCHGLSIKTTYTADADHKEVSAAGGQPAQFEPKST
ncbi:MAG: hypothetical protein LBK73_04345 [Treponema sp.]|nr:hypothetical protein [Treponema sp.]